ncbi:MAG: PDGLE domain-containing protein [Eubacteriales bacterium]
MKKSVLIILLAALAVAVFISPFASSFPDGLERVAEDLGFIQKGEEQVLKSPVPDYAFPGIKNEGLSTALAGAAGTLLAFGAMYALGRSVARRKNQV